MDTVKYLFDPNYGYSLKQLLAISPPTEPKDFDVFWQKRYQAALSIAPQPQMQIISEDTQGWRVFDIRYTSSDNFLIRGWLLVPTSGVIKRIPLYTSVKIG